VRETERLYRVARLVRLAIVGTLVLAVAVVVVGYFFLVRQVDAPVAWAEAARELQGSVLRYDEPVERAARVYQRRPTNYYRAATGLLAATPERLIYVGIEPRDQLAGPDAPAAIVTAEFRNDTLLHLTPERLYLLTAPGVRVTRGAAHADFAAPRGYAPELDSLVRFVRRMHAAQRAEAVGERKLRLQVAALLRRPLRYRVQRGDALSTIAQRFGVTEAEIRSWNHLQGNRVRLGDTLLVRRGVGPS